MSKMKVIAGMIAAISIISCATLKPITDTSETMKLHGCSMLPPQEHGWSVVSASKSTIDLGRSGATSDESYAAFVAVLEGLTIDDMPGQNDIEKLQSLARLRDLHEFSNERFQILILEGDTIQHGNQKCVKRYSKVIDFSAKKRSGNQNPMNMTSYGVYCMHPFLPKTIVQIGYSHRYYSINEDAKFEEKAFSWINNIQFDKP